MLVVRHTCQYCVEVAQFAHILPGLLICAISRWDFGQVAETTAAQVHIFICSEQLNRLKLAGIY